MDPLAEMHLLLREHGWEPVEHSEGWPTYWRWHKRGWKGWVETCTPLPGAMNPSWDIFYTASGPRVSGRSPRQLEKRLKELAQ
jgi:hypothetical protein